ncbi:MAG: SPASM domain-containing protein [Gammaproteobacteria bacterium]|nr:SPASM domain-containing protein [Gammaproteobacteria bacterium]MDH5729821.1 SPASM domain-containing protein [Gammaproteobacteria bacterium]
MNILVFVRKASNFSINYIRGFFSGFIPKPAPSLSIETTNVCNSMCVFCANPVMSRKKEQLSMDEYAKAVDDFFAMGGEYLDLCTTIGDPLLDKKILDRAKYIKQNYPHFTNLGFVSTLQWLHKYDMDKFLDSGFSWVSVSTTLTGKEKYEEFFGVKKYEQAMQNLQDLLLAVRNKNKKFAVVIGIKPTGDSYDDIVNHEDFARFKDIAQFDLYEAAKQVGYYVDDWSGFVKLPDYLKKRPLYPRYFRPCKMLYGSMIVYSNGKVGVCSCRDFNADSELILGHITENTLDELWNGEQLKNLRKNWRLKNQVPNICKTCRHYIY